LTHLRALGCNLPFHTLEEAVTDYVQEYLSNDDNPYL